MLLHWARLHLADEFHARHVDVVLREVVYNVSLADSLGSDVLVVQELSGTENERERLVVVQAPHSMGSSGLQHVGALDTAHKDEVLVEAPQDEGGVVIIFRDAQNFERTEPCRHEHLVSSSVIDSRGVSPRLNPVVSQLRRSVM